MFEPVFLNDQPTFIAKHKISSEACDQIIEASKILDPHPGMVASGVKLETKHSFDINVTTNYVFKKYQEELESFLKQYLQYFNLDQFGPPVGISDHMNIQRYPVGGAFFGIHADRGVSPQNRKRELVFMTYLNDVYVGGETEFLFQKIKFQPRKGLTIIWPAGWTHLHRGCPAPTEEKLITTGWFESLL